MMTRVLNAHVDWPLPIYYWVHAALTLEFSPSRFNSLVRPFLEAESWFDLIEYILRLFACDEPEPSNPRGLTPSRPNEHDMTEIMGFKGVLGRGAGEVTVSAEVEIYVHSVLTWY